MTDEIHAGDTGTVFVVTVTSGGVAQPIDDVSEKKLILSCPTKGIRREVTPSFVTTGSDGKLTYTTVANDIPATGDGAWKLQVYLKWLTGKERWSNVSPFMVYPNT